MAVFSPRLLDAYSIVHEAPEKDDEEEGAVPYEHTHIYFHIDKPCERSGRRLMDFKGIHPHVRMITSYDHAVHLYTYHKKAPILIQQEGMHNIPNGGQMEIDKWQHINELADAGKEREIRDTYPNAYFRCQHTIEKMCKRSQDDVEDLEKVHTVWYYGVTNTGKTTSAKQIAAKLYPGRKPYIFNPRTKWWDNYTNQPCVIVDELSPQHCTDSSLYKNLLDVTPLRVEYKGGFMHIRPETVIITSNYHPRECFPNDYGPISSRLKIGHCQKVYCEKKDRDPVYDAVFYDVEGCTFEE